MVILAWKSLNGVFLLLHACWERILHDVGFASTRPVVRNIRAPLDIIRPVPAKRPHWGPLCPSKEKVSGNVSLLSLLQFTRDLAQHTRPVVPVLCDYRISKMMYGEKTTGWNVRLFLRSHPILYGFWHAYKFCVTQTFRSFWPIVTFFRKGLFPHYVRSLREASRNNFSLIADSELSDVWTYSSRGDGSC